jgi:molybdopterin synthase catalytic subunit
MSNNITIRIQEGDFEIAREIAALTRGRTDIGAVVTFSGICRGSEDGNSIAALTLEHYPGMAEAEIARHVETAMTRWPLTGASVIHRVGRIAPGENIVLVLTRPTRRSGSARKAPQEKPGWKRDTTMTKPPRAGPGADGEARQIAGRAPARIEACEGQARRVGNAP